MRKITQKNTGDKKSWLLKQKTLELCQNLDEDKTQGKESIYKFLNDLLKKSNRDQKIALSWLIKKKAFSQLEAQRVFEFSIRCLKNNSQFILASILKAIKIQSPLREDLGFFLTDEGDTLGHLAAKQDKEDIIRTLSDLNPEYLRAKNLKGDTVPHIASKFLSHNSIELLIKKYPGLFYVRNNEGLKPSDLEGGPLINSMISEESIQIAWEKDSETYQKSLDTLKEASKESNKKKKLAIEINEINPK